MFYDMTVQLMLHEGLDWGGLRREWFELLCLKLFDPHETGLFTKFKDDKQALVGDT